MTRNRTAPSRATTDKSTFIPTAHHEPIPIRVLTHNIRYATTSPFAHEKPWKTRLPYLSSHLQYHTRAHFTPPSTLVCLQEVLHQQLQDLLATTFRKSASDGDDWTYLGVGRDDAQTRGEYSPIIFRTSAWKPLHFETVWLNETGAVGKKGWDATSVRILTAAILESTTSSSSSSTGGSGDRPTRILALNTHLDDSGAVARRESARIILATARRISLAWKPDFVFLAGDLNSPVSDGAYQLLNEPDSGFVDARRLVRGHPTDGDGEGHWTPREYGETLTFTDFKAHAEGAGETRIDFVHVGLPSTGGVEKAREWVKGYAVLPNIFDEQGVWVSDHRAVVVDMVV